jgi:hypothetical protein
MAALVDLKPQDESACAFDFVDWWGFVDVVVA